MLILQDHPHVHMVIWQEKIIIYLIPKSKIFRTYSASSMSFYSTFQNKYDNIYIHTLNSRTVNYISESKDTFTHLKYILREEPKSYKVCVLLLNSSTDTNI